MTKFCNCLTEGLDIKRAEGLWKESDDDPFKTLKETFTQMIEDKQSMKAIRPKMVDVNEIDVNTGVKNIIRAKPSINRGPQSPSPETQRDAEEPNAGGENVLVLKVVKAGDSASNLAHGRASLSR